MREIIGKAKASIVRVWHFKRGERWYGIQMRVHKYPLPLMAYGATTAEAERRMYTMLDNNLGRGQYSVEWCAEEKQLWL